MKGYGNVEGRVILEEQKVVKMALEVTMKVWAG
jgi:hypothetical protein